MKKLINKISVIVLATTAFTFTNCESLDQLPPQSLSVNTAFNTLKDAEYWRNGFYDILRSNTYGEFYQIADVQSDLLNATLAQNPTYAPFYNWSFLSDNSNISNIWFQRYNVIAAANLAIEKFPTIPTESAEQKQHLNEYLGEAYAVRAYAFFQLVEKFSPAYNSTNKNSKGLGVPLPLAYDVFAKPSRTTLEETYAQILSDIAKAEELLATTQGEIGANNFTIDSVKTLKMRVLLNKEEYAQAFAISQELINSGTYPLAKNADELNGIWHKDYHTESILQLYASYPSELPTTNSIYLNYQRFFSDFLISEEETYSPNFIASQWVIYLYEDSDSRKNIYFKELPTSLGGKNYKLHLVHKYLGNTELFNPNGNTNYAHLPKLFRIAEAYLITAESAYKIGNEAGAKQYLNLLRTARGASEITSSGANLFNDIKNERIREFAFEGSRIADLKRWGDPLRHSPQGTQYILSAPANKTYLLETPATAIVLFGPFRLTTELPIRILNKTKGTNPKNPSF